MAGSFMNGMVQQGYNGYRPEGTLPKAPSVYESSVMQGGEDYDRIMKGYQDLGRSSGQNTSANLSYVPISPTFSKYTQGPQYQRTGELDNAFGAAQNFVDTGGYSDTDVSSMRERGISPIRSIYANLQRNMARQKSLQGGYSPNFGAAASRMGREASDVIGNQANNVNAKIAEMVQSGKLAGLNQLAPLAATAARESEFQNQWNSRESDRANQVNETNAEEARRVDALNRQMELAYSNANQNINNTGFNNQLQSLEGQRSLYGTTPAMAALFGQQALASQGQGIQQQSMLNNAQAQRGQTGMDLIRASQSGNGLSRMG